MRRSKRDHFDLRINTQENHSLIHTTAHKVTSLMLSSEVLNSAARGVLCWFATVDANGQPNVSPKEVFAVLDTEYLVTANIASPTSVRNIEVSAPVSVSFIEIFVQKGFKIAGIARNVRRQDTEG